LGGLALAIVAMALLLRLLMLPLAARAERDSIVQRRLAPELAALHARLSHAAVRLRRAALATLRRNRVAATRNLFASLALLRAFTVLVAAVERCSAARAVPFLWAARAAPDPTFALPLVAGALLAAIVALQASGAKGRLLGALFVVGITWLVATCNAGAQLYLVA